MFSPEALSYLRCPMDPSHTSLTLEDQKILCQRCRLAFPMRDGFPIFLVEEAELPPGCSSLEQLPCQRAKTA
jgi:uncharacterized protein